MISLLGRKDRDIFRGDFGRVVDGGNAASPRDAPFFSFIGPIQGQIAVPMGKAGQVTAAWIAVRGSQTIDGRMTVKEKVFRPRGWRENGRCQRQRDQ